MQELRKLIKAKGFSYSYFAKRMDLSYNGFYYKVHGKFPFTLKESFILKEELGLNWKDYERIFKEVL